VATASGLRGQKKQRQNKLETQKTAETLDKLASKSRFEEEVLRAIALPPALVQATLGPHRSPLLAVISLASTQMVFGAHLPDVELSHSRLYLNKLIQSPE